MYMFMYIEPTAVRRKALDSFQRRPMACNSGKVNLSLFIHIHTLTQSVYIAPIDRKKL